MEVRGGSTRDAGSPRAGTSALTSTVCQCGGRPGRVYRGLTCRLDIPLSMVTAGAATDYRPRGAIDLQARTVASALAVGCVWRKPLGTGQFEPVMLSHAVLCRLAEKAPRSVLPEADAIADALSTLLAGKHFTDAVQQERDRWAEAHR